MLNRSLATLKGTFIFMTAFGLLMGIVFPFYSFLFFGTGAFSPFYVAGCLTAGFMVGSFCFLVIKRVLRLSIERQYDALGRIVALDTAAQQLQSGDQLEASMTLLQTLLRRIELLIGSVTDKTGQINPRCSALANSARQLTDGNARQVDQVAETVDATKRMNQAFGTVLIEVEGVRQQTEERTAITTEMSGSISAIADMVEQYNRSVDTTSRAIGEIAGSLQQVALRVEDLSGASEGAASAITEISASINEVRDHSLITSEASQKVQEHAREGIGAVEQLIASMADIDASSRTSATTIARLTEHASRIGSVLDIITDIVEQTNLLSLNASIIAAQAGSKGRAFAVVAEEIRSLAQRTANSTREIATLVTDIQSDTNAMEGVVRRGIELAGSGVKASGRAQMALATIVDSAKESAGMVRRIADATSEQANTSASIARTTEENMERFLQVRKAIETQHEQVQRIVQNISEMTNLSKRIEHATREQARANQQYLKSQVEDSERAKAMAAAATEQRELGMQVGNFLKQAQQLIVANAEEARRMREAVEEIATLSSALKQDLADFSATGGTQSQDEPHEEIDATTEAATLSL